MECILCVQAVIYTLPQQLLWCVQYNVIMYRVITALDSIYAYMCAMSLCCEYHICELDTHILLDICFLLLIIRNQRKFNENHKYDI